jgi:hypothetical protein
MRLAPVAVVGALLAVTLVACGGDDPSTVESDTTTTAVAGRPGTTAAATSGGGGDDAPAGTTPGGQPTTTAGPVAPASPDTSGSPGSAAPLYLRPSPADTVVVEVSRESGVSPTAATLTHVASVLGKVTGKPVETAAGGTVSHHDAWTAADLRAAADGAAVVRQGDRAVVRLLFVHGQYADDDSVLGISVRADVAAVFVDRVAAAADPITGAGPIERAVTTHEVGHLLGLVDLYRKTGREDPDHPGHSTNRNSVMYWAVESTLVTDLLTGGPPSDFDADDLADLAATRAGA